MDNASPILWRNLRDLIHGGTLYRTYVMCVYLKAIVIVNMDLLKSFVQYKVPFLRSTSPTVAALTYLGMTYDTAEVMTGGYAASTKRVYVNDHANKRDSVVIKSVSSAIWPRVWSIAFGGFKREVNFYLEIAPTFPLSTPRCSFSKFYTLRGSGLIVMEDIQGGALARERLLTRGKGQTLVEEAMKVAARIHGKYWGATPTTLTRSTLGKYPWLSDFYLVQGNRAMYECNRGFARTFWNDIKRAIVEKGTSNSCLGYLRSRPDFTKFIDGVIEGSTWDAYQEFRKTFRHPLTLIHGDYRLSNQLWVEEENKLYTIDWAEASVGDGPSDIAYYFFNYPHISDRRKWEDEMLRIYWEELGEQGVDLSCYPLSMCREAYVRTGIDRGIQMLVGLLGCNLHVGEVFDDIFVRDLAEQVDAFISDHKDEYRGPHLLISGRWLW